MKLPDKFTEDGMLTCTGTIVPAGPITSIGNVTGTADVSVTRDDADLAGSAELVAVTVIVCSDETLVGAIYSPDDEMLPTGGLNAHETPGFVVPVTVALNCRLSPAFSEPVVGKTETETPGYKYTTVLAFLPDDVAITHTFWALLVDEGAVYSPDEEMLPTTGLIAQVAGAVVVEAFK